MAFVKQLTAWSFQL